MLLAIDLLCVVLVLGWCGRWLVSRIWKRGDGLNVFGDFDAEKQK